jgi:hypothetical protein
VHYEKLKTPQRTNSQAMPNKLPIFVIEGITLDGKTFRPSDWIERLIDTLSSYGVDRRMPRRPYTGPERRRQQTNFLCVQMIEGRKCLVVDARLRDANPMAFGFLQEFAQSNHLRVQEPEYIRSERTLIATATAHSPLP